MAQDKKLNVWHKILIVNAIKDTHGTQAWQDEMMWKKDWQDMTIATKIVSFLVEEIRLEKIENLEKELKELKGENK